MQDLIFQIQIVLKGSKPKIWRRILIPSNLYLADFHDVIQITMGWENSHMHHFVKEKIFYSAKMEKDDWDMKSNIDYKEIILSDLLTKKHDKIIYEYDFGDGWEHEIILEEIVSPIPDMKYPVCLDGKMSCPPEDSGGILRYNEMLNILKNPEHKFYENYRDWLSEDFDPHFFNKDDVNLKLQHLFSSTPI